MKRKIILTFTLSLIFGFGFTLKSSAQCSTSSQPTNNCAGFGDAIDKVTINGVSTTTGSSNGCGTVATGYGIYTAPVFSFAPGQSNSFSALLGSGTESEGFAIFIDLNNDGFFSGSNELVYAHPTAGTNISGSFTVPANTPGLVTGTPLKMRFRCSWLRTSWTVSDACTNNLGSYGETEDYTVIFCDPVSFVTHPATAIGCEGDSTSFYVEANTSDVTYQWQRDQGSGFTNVTNSTIYSGATTSRLKLSNMTTSLDGGNYRCIITSTCNTSLKDTSNSDILTVVANANIASQSITDTTCEGLNTRFGIKADGAVNTYIWQMLQYGNWVTINATAPFSGVTSDTLVLTGVSDTLNGAQFRCIAVGACKSDTTNTIMSLGVNAVPKVITDPNNVTVIQGNSATFNVIAVGVGVSYQWQAGVNGTFSNINNQSIYSGVNTANLTVAGVTEAQTGFQFRCIVKGVGGCAADPDTSAAAILNVLPPLGVSNATANNSSIYPNPVSGAEVMITFNSRPTEHLGYRIVNTLGKVVAEGSLTNSNNHATKIFVENFSAGIYTIQILDANKTLIQNMKFSRL